ncbi:hypothetical protein E2C01_089532 [Portunus trituberculatus]|uniref:Uncharacterized protein n=1 Tax=Portunus trituberculatus TaxID=210409 RepID=A0A5B7JIG7_PORTR|nr:hypothetical protein [Portunus trituberculatus]
MKARSKSGANHQNTPTNEAPQTHLAGGTVDRHQETQSRESPPRPPPSALQPPLPLVPSHRHSST